jgi:predicted flap endonuclease-1-like 5' DNA nuclease
VAWFIGQSAVMIVLAFLLGLLVGWVIWHRRGNAAERPVDEPTAEICYPEEPTTELPLSEQPDGEAGAEAPVEAEAGEAVAAESVTAAVEEPPSEGPADAEAAPDDLARIEGIGPKISAALIASDIRTYRELADAQAPVLEEAINKAGIKFAPSIVTWSRQAALLAAGDEDGFRELTDQLVAGRDAARQA